MVRIDFGNDINADWIKHVVGRDGLTTRESERALYDGQTLKHLAGRHDQKSHAPHTLSVVPDTTGTKNYKVVKPLSDRGLKYIADAYGISTEEYTARLERAMRRELNSSEIHIRLSENTLSNVLEDGKFESASEAGQSSSAYRDAGKSFSSYLRIRQDTENDMFGENNSPIYGYFEKDEVQSTLAQAYGSVSVALKSEVKKRATFTDADSLDYGVYDRFIPSKVTDPKYYSSLFLTNFSDPLAVWTKKERRGWSNYIEAQIFGGVSVDDIDHVVFDKMPSMKTVQALKDRGIRYWVQQQ